MKKRSRTDQNAFFFFHQLIFLSSNLFLRAHSVVRIAKPAASMAEKASSWPTEEFVVLLGLGSTSVERP
jgi:hypothetical protein